MLISLAWLRELAALDAESPEIARRLTARGLTVEAVTEEDGDTVFDIDVPANRPDALGHLGVAREAAAAFGVSLLTRSDSPKLSGPPVERSLGVTIEDTERCGRYTAGLVRGVRVGPSPPWVVRRLAAVGLRSRNNVVDASNLVMLELGQPVHFFDLARIDGGAIRVRAAHAGETLVTLDGVARTLDEDMLLIADARRAIALAGVMGGADTEIRETTRDVLVEAAWFDPASVRRTARALGLSTDASQRFERGCDPEAPAAAQECAARLLSELAGGQAAPGTIDVRPAPSVRRVLEVRLTRAARLLGYAPTKDEAMSALAAVGLSPRANGEVVEVTVPSFRVDLEREADLVEEIGRHLGYDRIPSRAPWSAPPRPSRSGAALEDLARDHLAASGFAEALNYAMIAEGDDQAFVPSDAAGALPLVNPIAETLAVLRRSLLPGLLRAADANRRRGAPTVRLFEVGSVFLARGRGELPHEPRRAAIAWSGSADAPHWSAPVREVDPFDIAGVVEGLLAVLAGADVWSRERAAIPGLQPGRSFAWRAGDAPPAAWCGPVHPELSARLDLAGTIFLAEIDLDRAVGVPVRAPSYRPIPRVPGVARDLSIVFERDAEAGGVLAALARVPPPAPVTFAWLDRYAGPPLAASEVAMTLRVMLQPLDRTLTDAEAEGYRAQLLAALDAVPGARLRRMDT